VGRRVWLCAASSEGGMVLQVGRGDDGTYRGRRVGPDAGGARRGPHQVGPLAPTHRRCCGLQFGRSVAGGRAARVRRHQGSRRCQMPRARRLGRCPGCSPAQEMLVAADRPTVNSCGRCRHAHPVRSTYRIASRYFRHRRGGHVRPPRGWSGTTNRVIRVQAVSERSDRYRRRCGWLGPDDFRWC
jgi:hypothetical protein